MRLALIGPPGIGKGTQARQLAGYHEVPHLSTGEMLRREAARDSPQGRALRALMKQGSLVDDDRVLQVLQARLNDPDCARGFILDGYPRTLDQALALADLLAGRGEALQAVVFLEGSLPLVLDRLSQRRICEDCGVTFNARLRPSGRQASCDECGGALTRRADDEPETIRRRWRVYEEETLPLVAHYDDLGLLVRIDATQGVEETFTEVTARLDNRPPSSNAGPA